MHETVSSYIPLFGTVREKEPVPSVIVPMVVLFMNTEAATIGLLRESVIVPVILVWEYKLLPKNQMRINRVQEGNLRKVANFDFMEGLFSCPEIRTGNKPER